MKLLKPISCRREIGGGNVNTPDTLVESLVEGFSDGSSILPASTKKQADPNGSVLLFGGGLRQKFEYSARLELVRFLLYPMHRVEMVK